MVFAFTRICRIIFLIATIFPKIQEFCLIINRHIMEISNSVYTKSLGFWKIGTLESLDRSCRLCAIENGLLLFNLKSMLQNLQQNCGKSRGILNTLSTTNHIFKIIWISVQIKICVNWTTRSMCPIFYITEYIFFNYRRLK